MSYYFAKTLEISFEDAIRRTTEALRQEGFGIITEIDVRDTLKKKGSSRICVGKSGGLMRLRGPFS